MLKTTHTSGTKSFARKAHEIKMSDPEKREPNRAELYLATHKRKDGTFLDDEVALAIQKQMEEPSEMASNLEGRVAWEGDILSQVFGKDKDGHIRGVGLVSDPKSVLQPTRRYQNMDVTSLDEKMLIVLVRKLLGKVEKQGVELEELKGKVYQMEYGTSSTQTTSDSPNEGISPNASAYNDQQPQPTHTLEVGRHRVVTA